MESPVLIEKFCSWLFKKKEDPKKETTSIVTIPGLEYLKFEKDKFYVVLYDPTMIDNSTIAEIASAGSNIDAIFSPVKRIAGTTLIDSLYQIEENSIRDIQVWAQSLLKENK